MFIQQVSLGRCGMLPNIRLINYGYYYFKILFYSRGPQKLEMLPNTINAGFPKSQHLQTSWLAAVNSSVQLIYFTSHKTLQMYGFFKSSGA